MADDPTKDFYPLPRATPLQLACAMKVAGWPNGSLREGVATAMAESGGNLNATHLNVSDGSIDLGAWQINNKAHADFLQLKLPYAKGPNGKFIWQWQIVDINAGMALIVHQQAGGSWSPWLAHGNSLYQLYYNGVAINAASTASKMTDAQAKAAIAPLTSGVSKVNLKVEGNPLNMAVDAGLHLLVRIAYVGAGALLILMAIGGLIKNNGNPLKPGQALQPIFVPMRGAANLGKGLAGGLKNAGTE